MASTPSAAASYSADPPAWIRPYLKIPYAVLDCWQLCGHVLRLEAGVELPSFAEDYEATADMTRWERHVRGRVASIVERELPLWQKVEGEPACFDIALYRGGGAGWHTALVVGGGWLLNTNLRRGSHPIRLRDPAWWPRLDGCYRIRRDS